MARFRGTRDAFGQPGLEPRWTYADKDGVGTAYAISSRIWFTLLKGVLTEIYYPTVDRPQVRDLQSDYRRLELLSRGTAAPAH